MFELNGVFAMISIVLFFTLFESVACVSGDYIKNTLKFNPFGMSSNISSPYF